jgi:hypothetical protein
MNNIKNNKDPILANAGSANMKVLKINFNDFALFANLKILIILKVLKIEVAVPNLLKKLVCSIIIPKLFSKIKIHYFFFFKKNNKKQKKVKRKKYL